MVAHADDVFDKEGQSTHGIATFLEAFQHFEEIPENATDEEFDKLSFMLQEGILLI